MYYPLLNGVVYTDAGPEINVEMLNELALTCSSDGSYVWDFRAGTVVLSLRQNNSSKHAVDLVPYSGHAGRVGLVMCAQSDRAIINVYSWQKVSLIKRA